MKVDHYMTHTTCQHGDLTGRFCLLPLYVLWKFHSAFILRTPRSSLDVHQQAWQTHASLSHHPSSVCLPCQAEKKPIHCMSAAKALSSPFFSRACTPTTTSTCIYKHAWTHTLTHALADRNTSGEPVKIWVTQQEQGVWIYSDWCSVLTFSDNGWEIMEKADIQTVNTAAAWCLWLSWIETSGLTLYFDLKSVCDLSQQWCTLSLKHGFWMGSCLALNWFTPLS